MKTKHSRSEMNSLAKLVTDISNMWPAEDIEDRLIKLMMQRFAIELNNRVVIIQKEYKLNWHPERALAFAVAFRHAKIKDASYEQNLVLQLINQIEQQTVIAT